MNVRTAATTKHTSPYHFTNRFLLRFTLLLFIASVDDFLIILILCTYFDVRYTLFPMLNLVYSKFFFEAISIAMTQSRVTSILISIEIIRQNQTCLYLLYFIVMHLVKNRNEHKHTRFELYVTADAAVVILSSYFFFSMFNFQPHAVRSFCLSHVHVCMPFSPSLSLVL